MQYILIRCVNFVFRVEGRVRRLVGVRRYVLEMTNLKDFLGEDAKIALVGRVEHLLGNHSLYEIERIIYSELDEIGMTSEDFMDVLDGIINDYMGGEFDG